MDVNRKRPLNGSKYEQIITDDDKSERSGVTSRSSPPVLDRLPAAGPPRGPIGWLTGRLAFGDETSRTTVSATRKATLEKATLANEVEKVEIPVGDLTLRGHLYKPEQSQKLRQTVIIFPGSGAPAEDSAWFIARRYQRIGVQALVINYRGFGESDGRPSEKGFYEDARAICNYATDELGVPHNELWLHGYSIGAPVGAHLAGYLNELGKDIGGIVLDRPMPSTSKGGCRAWFTQSSRPSCKVGNREHECQQ